MKHLTHRDLITIAQALKFEIAHECEESVDLSWIYASCVALAHTIAEMGLPNNPFNEDDWKKIVGE